MMNIPTERSGCFFKTFSKKSPKPLYKTDFIPYNNTNDCDREDSEQSSRQREIAMGWKRSWRQRRLCARESKQGKFLLAQKCVSASALSPLRIIE